MLTILYLRDNNQLLIVIVRQSVKRPALASTPCPDCWLSAPPCSPPALQPRPPPAPRWRGWRSPQSSPAWSRPPPPPGPHWWPPLGRTSYWPGQTYRYQSEI